MAVNEGTRRIVGGVDTHKDQLHVAAVVDEQDRVIETRSLRHHPVKGYRQMLAWMRAFGDLQRIGVESRPAAMAQAFSVSCSKPGLPVPRGQQPRTSRIAAKTWQERRSRCSERGPCRLCRPTDRDAAKPGLRHDRDPLRVLMACRKTAVSARRVALQMIHNTIVCAPDGLRDQLRSLTRMQLVSAPWPRGARI